MMGTEGLSAGDILALTKDNDNGMSGAWNNPFIYLVSSSRWKWRSIW